MSETSEMGIETDNAVQSLRNIPDEFIKEKCIFYHVICDSDFGCAISSQNTLMNYDSLVVGKLRKNSDSSSKISIVNDKHEAERLAQKILDIAISRGSLGNGDKKQYPYLGVIILKLMIKNIGELSHRKVEMSQGSDKYGAMLGVSDDIIYWEKDGKIHGMLSGNVVSSGKVCVTNCRYMVREELNEHNGFALLNLNPNLKAEQIRRLKCLYHGDKVVSKQIRSKLMPEMSLVSDRNQMEMGHSMKASHIARKSLMSGPTSLKSNSLSTRPSFSSNMTAEQLGSVPTSFKSSLMAEQVESTGSLKQSYSSLKPTIRSVINEELISSTRPSTLSSLRQSVRDEPVSSYRPSRSLREAESAASLRSNYIDEPASSIRGSLMGQSVRASIFDEPTIPSQSVRASIFDEPAMPSQSVRASIFDEPIMSAKPSQSVKASIFDEPVMSSRPSQSARASIFDEPVMSSKSSQSLKQVLGEEPIASLRGSVGEEPVPSFRPSQTARTSLIGEPSFNQSIRPSTSQSLRQNSVVEPVKSFRPSTSVPQVSLKQSLASTQQPSQSVRSVPAVSQSLRTLPVGSQSLRSAVSSQTARPSLLAPSVRPSTKMLSMGEDEEVEDVGNPFE